MSTRMTDPITLHPVGSTGTGASGSSGKDMKFDQLGMQFTVEAVGGSPSVTFKGQGSLNGTDWFDLLYVTDSSDSAVTTAITRTTTGSSIIYPVRPYRFYRFNVTANSNVTYHSEMYPTA